MPFREPPPARSRPGRRAPFGLVVPVVAGAATAFAAWPGLPLAARIAWLVAAAALVLASWQANRHDAERGRRLRHARRLELVSRAALELQQLRDGDEVLREACRLLVDVLGCASARIGVPEGGGSRVLAAAGDPPAAADATVAQRVVRERRLVYDAGETGAAVSVFALPLALPRGARAVLEVRRAGRAALGLHDREVIEAVARLAEEALAHLDATATLRRRQRQSEALARMSERLLFAGSPAQAAEIALEHLQERDGGGASLALRLEGARLIPFARAGDPPPEAAALLAAGPTLDDPVLGRVWREGRPLHACDEPEAFAEGPAAALAARGAIVPVADAHGATRALLLVTAAEGARPSPAVQRSHLGSVASALGATLQRLLLQEQLRELLEVVRAMVDVEDPAELYDQAVDAVVRLVPGAEAASILVRREDGYHFAAAEGFDMALLREVGPYSHEEQLAWHGLGAEAFGRGVPRLLRGADIQRLTTAASREAQVEALGRARLPDLRATITVPIVAGRQVLGMLNVDALSREDAFGDAELELTETFAQHVGVIIRQVQGREALARAAITDPVTGLGNREGFNRRLELDLARAARREEAVHLVMMDLDGFKRINDELGHHAGDLALQRVARALEAGLRAEDGLFRWGGDEFALVMSGLDDATAERAAARHAAAVARLEVGGRRLSLSTGIAAFPRDGRDADALLRRADDLMYRHKDRTAPS